MPPLMLIMHSERERIGKREWHSAKEKVKRKLSRSVCGSEHEKVFFFRCLKAVCLNFPEPLLLQEMIANGNKVLANGTEEEEGG